MAALGTLAGRFRRSLTGDALPDHPPGRPPDRLRRFLPGARQALPTDRPPEDLAPFPPTIILSLRAIIDSVTGLTPLKRVAEVAMRVLDLHDKVTARGDDCRRLARRVASVLEVIINRVGVGEEVPPELRHRIDSLTCTLEQISTFMADLQDRSTLLRAAHYDQDTAELRMYNELLDDSLQAFFLHSNMQYARDQLEGERVNSARHALSLAADGELQLGNMVVMEMLAHALQEFDSRQSRTDAAVRKIQQQHQHQTILCLVFLG